MRLDIPQSLERALAAALGGRNVALVQFETSDPDAPLSVTARAEWRGARVALSARHIGRFYLDNTENRDRVNDAYTIADVAARAPLPVAWTGATRTRLALDLRLNNLFDARYTTFGYVDGGVPLFIPAAGRNVYVGMSISR